MGNPQPSKQKTIELLMSRAKERNDFPAMSRTVDIVKKQTSSVNDTSITELTSTILDDFALTSKLLRLVNSVFYINYQLGGKIGTISRAVFVLGYEQVKSAAVTLLLFENLTNKNLAKELKETVLSTFMSGLIAKGMAAKVGIEDTEEAFLGSIFHNLGRLLVSFYLPDHRKKIREEMTIANLTEHSAAKEVLGATYEDIAVAMAQSWNLPDKLITAMHKVPSGPVTAPVTHDDKIKTLVNLSTEICDKMAEIKANPQVLKNILKRYADCFQFSEKAMTGILDTALKDLGTFVRTMKLSIGESDFLKKISGVISDAQLDDVSEGVMVSPTDEEHVELDDTQFIRLMGGVDDKEPEETPDEVLSNGIQEVANSLMENTSINDILRTILEIMFRGMNFSRVLICIKNVGSTGSTEMVGRFGFGSDTDEIIKRFRFLLNDASDIFNLAILRNTDVVIGNINDPRFKSRIPDWYRKYINAQTFLLLPIVVNNKPIGLIYADKPKAGDIQIPPHQLTLIKTLRNQAIMAIQKRK
ncbi:MAG: HDOD domain-containing protein [Nitrospirae bacterium]|nr:HDOD domain-containing protein [Nitrospirota bacterium]MBF0534892.1 HDOD domain-containing protein [Nitrospirota bacterium]MBF0616807.1 HDOD domain-containing protein [Nitrospirota bacterium]